MRPERIPCAGRTLDVSRPVVMGILNTTPDSFHAASRLPDVTDAVARAEAMVAEGAGILDVGGESSRPGSEPVDEATERARVLPVVEALVDRVDVPISIDTRRASVAAACLEAGAHIVNDISAGRDDPRLFEVAAEHEAAVVLMHMQGRPRDMQRDPTYDDVVQEVRSFLVDRAGAARKAGLRDEAILLDPGIGFGKTLAHNLALLRHMDTLLDTGHPVLVGHSRKRYLGDITGRETADRLAGTVATSTWLALQGVQVLRVHDVAETVDAVRVACALEEVEA